MGSYRSYENGAEPEEDPYSSIFKTLTVKQHEVYALVAEGRSTKEIAWKLGVSDSAVNQRIEAVRSRAGSPTRAEMARAYRRFLASHDLSSFEPPMRYAPASSASFFHNAEAADFPAVSAASDGHQPAPMMASNLSVRDGLIVPPIFMGPNAGLNRVAAMVLIALGLLAAALIGLGVLHALAMTL